MSESTNTLAGILALNDRNLSPEEASVILNKAPVLAILHAQRASQGGTTHKFQRKLTAPGVGFRLVNEGITNATRTFEIVTQSLALLDATVKRDKGVVIAMPANYMNDESTDSLAEAMFALECAMFRANLNKQFTGLPGSAYFDQITVDGQVINAGGNGGKSVWLLRSSPNGISMVLGQDGKLNVGDDMEVALPDASNRTYPGIQRSILGWAGLQVGGLYDAVRIANLDGTAGHTLTDDLLYEGVSKFPVGAGPNIIAMTRSALRELRQSRTATNPTGTPAPMPTSLDGIQIVVTDSIPNDEAALNTTTTTTTTSTQA